MGDTLPKDAFQITEGKDGKSYWTKVGMAFVNKDGSINVFLDAFPPKAKKEASGKVETWIEEVRGLFRWLKGQLT